MVIEGLNLKKWLIVPGSLLLGIALLYVSILLSSTIQHQITRGNLSHSLVDKPKPIKPEPLPIIQKKKIEKPPVNSTKIISPVSKNILIIEALDSKSRILLHNSSDYKIFVSNLTLSSIDDRCSSNVQIEKIIDRRSYLKHEFPIDHKLDNNGGFVDIPENLWQQMLQQIYLNETKCIQWDYFTANDTHYQTIKKFITGHSFVFHEIPIKATLYFRPDSSNNLISQDVKVFAVPFVNKECLTPDYKIFRFQ
jgi:hypothetical protein